MKRFFWSYPLVLGCAYAGYALQEQVMYGDVSITNSTVQNQVKIIGRGSVTKSIFQSPVSVMGTLDVSHSEFEKDLYIVGSDLLLDHDRIHGDLHVTNYLRKPVVKMNHSAISGRIVFHSLKPGVVVADEQSEVESGIENGAKQ